MSSKLIKANLPNAEGFFLEINLTKKKWVISSSYNPHNQTIFSHIENMGQAVDSFFSKHEKCSIIGDFNARRSDTSVKDFCGIYSFKHLKKSNMLQKSY